MKRLAVLGQKSMAHLYFGGGPYLTPKSPNLLKEKIMLNAPARILGV